MVYTRRLRLPIGFLPARRPAATKFEQIVTRQMAQETASITSIVVGRHHVLRCKWVFDEERECRWHIET